MTTAPRVPTVKFDESLVTREILDDLRSDIRRVPEFAGIAIGQIYEAARQCISRGGDLASLFNAIIAADIPGMSRRRASEITQNLSRKSLSLIEQRRQLASGLTEAVWLYSGAPCLGDPQHATDEERRRDAGHKAANGKRFKIADGMLINGHRTYPGRDDGCKCIAKPIVKGFS